MLDIEKLSKKELLAHINELKTQLAAASKKPDTDSLIHDLSVHKIERRVQNRALIKSQQSLEESRDSYADLYDFAPVNYASFDETGLIKAINLTCATMLGSPRREMIDKEFSKWVSKEDVGLFFSHLREVFQGDNKVITELQLHNCAGILYKVRLESIRTSDIATVEPLCRTIILDVTEINKARNNAILKARQLRLITDALPVLVAYIDVHEQYTFVNRKYAKWFGNDELSAKSIVGTNISKIWHGDEYLYLIAHLRIALAGDGISFNMELYNGENVKKSFHVEFLPDMNLDGRVSGVVLVLTDTTERLALESIDRKRLRDAAHISRLSSMGVMASEIAHEINQPLAAISVYSDACRRMLLSGGEDRDKIIDALNDISTQADRAGKVIRHIRDFTSKKDIVLEAININSLVKDTVDLLKFEFKLHEAKLELDIANNLPMVSVDKILIEQVIYNLAHNALDAMSNTPVTKRRVKIKTAMCTNNAIYVSVEDTGCGISEEQVKKMFIPFQTNKKDGMGLGLAICKSIIEAHHGSIQVTSNAHDSTTFNFTIPIAAME